MRAPSALAERCSDDDTVVRWMQRRKVALLGNGVVTSPPQIERHHFLWEVRRMGTADEGLYKPAKNACI